MHIPHSIFYDRDGGKLLQLLKLNKMDNLQTHSVSFRRRIQFVLLFSLTMCARTNEDEVIKLTMKRHIRIALMIC